MTTIELNNSKSLYGIVKAVQVKNYAGEMPRYFSSRDYLKDEIGNYILDSAMTTCTILSAACARDDLHYLIKCISSENISLYTLNSAIETEYMRECGIRISVEFELTHDVTLGVISRNWNASTIDDI